jgi:ABC-type multidrug transport system permease subunit
VWWLYRWCQVLVVFDRERDDHLYSATAWVVSETIANAPINIVVPVLYSILVYFMANLRSGADLAYSFGCFLGANILVQFCFVGFALLAASIDVRRTSSR